MYTQDTEISDIVDEPINITFVIESVQLSTNLAINLIKVEWKWGDRHKTKIVEHAMNLPLLQKTSGISVHCFGSHIELWVSKTINHEELIEILDRWIQAVGCTTSKLLKS